MESDPRVLEKLPDPSRPPITFGGTMRGFNSDDVLNRGIRGTVQVMKDGHIQWSYVSLNRQQKYTIAYRLPPTRLQYITVSTNGGSIGQFSRIFSPTDLVA